MSSIIQAGEFFVVGGPVQPDRPCYVERAADHVLEAGIRAQQFCFVLGPRAIGKSSLMGRIVRALRREGQLAAVVDLAQLDARGDSGDADRWFYGIAYRIVHELRLKVDLSGWWTEKGVLGEQRFRDFFWEIVLTHTTAPITVLIDEIERSRDLPFAQELFAAIGGCYTRRAIEPDYARLSFVVLGVATADELCRDRGVSPFLDGRSIELADFDAAQTYQLALGFGGEPAQAQALMDRICAWTGGHPYLTQKVARGVARKGGKLEDVERVVKEQLLSPAAAQDDPLLNHVGAVLKQRSPASRQALSVLRRVARGANVQARAESAGLRLMQLAGVVSIDRDKRVRYRNRIFKEAFGTRWIKSVRPARWRIAAAFLVLAGGAWLGSQWYREYLPQPYIETLSAESADWADVESAYEELRNLPGFAERAEQLYADAVARRSRDAADFAAAAEADRALRAGLVQPELADRLLADFWLRQSLQAMHAERRDDALLYALQALPAEPARAALTELIGEDYPLLERSLEWPRNPAHVVVDWPQRRAIGIDAAGELRSLDLEPAGRVPLPERLTALEYRPIERTLQVDEPGSAGAFELTLGVQHPASDELTLTLTAPSGAQASLSIPQRGAELARSFIADESSPLEALADEDREGDWRLAIVDRRADNTGLLLDWGLSFDRQREPWRDDPEGGVAIPDPARTEDVKIELAANGRFAIVQSAQPGAIGSLTLWNLRDGTHTDLPLAVVPTHVRLTADSTRLLAVAGDALLLWNVPDALQVARLTTQTRFVLPPALSTDGEYMMIAEQVEGAPPLFSLLRTQNAEFLTSIEGIDGVERWLLGPQARYLVLSSAADTVRVINPRGGAERPPLVHARPIREVFALPGAVLTVDAAGDIRAWPLAATAAPSVLGTTVDPQSVAVAGTRIAFAVAGAAVAVRDVAAPVRAPLLRVEPSDAVTATYLSPDGGVLLTAAGPTHRLWRLPETRAADEPAALPEFSVFAVDRQGELAALGFRGGYVRAASVAQLGRAPLATSGLDYFAHRGAVGSLALNAAQGLILSGGAGDGRIRLWDAATMIPLEQPVLQHSGGAVRALAISHDGGSIASATPSSVRLWRTADGAPLAEITLDGAQATAIAYSSDDRWLAVGDDRGRLQLFDAASGTSARATATLEQPLRWVAFGAADGSSWLAATDHWLHEIELAADELRVTGSRLLPSGFAPVGPSAQAGSVRLVGGLGTARLAFTDLPLGAPVAEPLPADSELLARDWAEVLGRQVDGEGAIVPIAR